MGVQDRDWYHEDRARKERQRERDPRTTEYHPKQFRGSHNRTPEEPAKDTHWLVQAGWWFIATIALWLAYLYVTTINW